MTRVYPLGIRRATLSPVREDEREADGAVWAQCPRCLIPFELDVLEDGAYYLLCPCCGMTRVSV